MLACHPALLALRQAAAKRASPLRSLPQLAGYLAAQIQAAGAAATHDGGPIGGSAKERELAALLRMASMPLATLGHQLLQRSLLPGPDEAAARARHTEVTHALRVVLQGGGGVEYCWRASQGSSGGGGGSQGMSRRDFQRFALELTGSDDWLGRCSELFEQAGLGSMLRLLGSGDSLPTKLPPKVRPGQLICMPGILCSGRLARRGRRCCIECRRPEHLRCAVAQPYCLQGTRPACLHPLLRLHALPGVRLIHLLTLHVKTGNGALGCGGCVFELPRGSWQPAARAGAPRRSGW